VTKQDRRKASRVRHRIKIDLGARQAGIITNLSEFGLFIQTSHLLPPGSPIVMEVAIDKPIPLRGTVVWSRTGASLPGIEAYGGIGIVFFSPPQEWLDFVSKTRKTLEHTRRGIEERFEVCHPVRFESQEAFLTNYTENLSRGGMYLATKEDLKPGTTIRAVIEIPGMADPLEVVGRVAYRLNEKEAEERGRTPGAGVQFVEISPQAKVQLDHYLRRLKIHSAQPERRQTQKISPSGSFSDFLVPELLLGFLSDQSTGVLKLSHRGITKTVYLHKGRPVFVQSPLRTETLGHFLIRYEKLKSEDLEESLLEVATTDMQLGEVLLKRGLIDGATLAQALVMHQEEKLTNTFPWFDGTYEFSKKDPWPANVSLFPLRTYQMIFEGIERWYDASVVVAWMGLSEDSYVERLISPPLEATIPPRIARLCQIANRKMTVKELSNHLRVSAISLFPTVFSLILAGWVKISSDAPSLHEQKEKLSPEKKLGLSDGAPTETIVSKLKNQVDQDYKELCFLNFYELLKVGTENASGEMLDQAFVRRMARYSSVPIEDIKSNETQEKLQQILSWIRLAYDTLRDPHLRQIYARRGEKRAKRERDASKMEAERLLLSGLRDLGTKNVKEAITKIRKAVEMNANDKTLKGYLGAALFQQDEKKNFKAAMELLNEAIEYGRTDSQLWYFRGEMHTFNGNWLRAERDYSHALRLHPRFSKALNAFEKVRERRIGDERKVAKASKKER